VTFKKADRFFVFGYKLVPRSNPLPLATAGDSHHKQKATYSGVAFPLSRSTATATPTAAADAHVVEASTTALVERFKAKMLAEGYSKTTLNRYLATLRKALRYASRKLKLFDKLPIIEMFKRSQKDGIERQRDYIFSDADYKNWLAIAPEPLRSASVLARNAGICRGEMLAMERDCIHMNEDVDDNGLFGSIEIRLGLKRDERKRTLPITA